MKIDKNDLLDKIKKSGISQKIQKVRINKATYPYSCVIVEDQGQTCKITPVNELPDDLKKLYIVKSGIKDEWSIEESLFMTVDTCYLFTYVIELGSITINGASLKNFKNTRPNPPGNKSKHNFGKAFDLKIAGKMPIDGDNYSYIDNLFTMICAGINHAYRIYFSDKDAVKEANEILKNEFEINTNPCRVESNHNDHIHIELQ